MEFNYVLWFTSPLPVVFLLVLMSRLNLKSYQSAGLSLAAALLIAGTVFRLEVFQLGLAAAKGAALSLYIILIITGAIILYNTVEISGGFNSIRSYMLHLGGDRLTQLLGLSWAFAAFIQGVSGFGVPVAVAGSILKGIGFAPVLALSAVLIGHSWSVTFGSMGSSFFAINLVTGLEGLRLGTVMALLFYLPVFCTGLTVAWLYGRGRACRKALPLVTLTGLLMASFQFAAARGGFPQIGALIGGLSGTLLFLLLMRRGAKENEAVPEGEGPTIYGAAFPYLLLIISIVLVQLPAVRALLPEWELSFNFPGFTTPLGYTVVAEEGYAAVQIFAHPILFLLLAGLGGVLLYIKQHLLTGKDILKITTSTAKQASSSALSILLLMAMALVMNDSGMIYTFARGVARFSGRMYPLASPLVGTFGAFITGSNTSSNVLLGAFQTQVAELLDVSPYLLAGAQSVGGALGSAIAPAKILLGISVVGAEGKDGEILRTTLGYTLLIVLLVGLLILVLS